MKRFFATTMAAAILLSLTSAFAADPIDAPSSFRYKVTVRIETPDGIKTGSAVREANSIRIPAGASSAAKRTAQAEYEGEAVTIDLGKQGVIFALVDHSTGFGISAEQLKLFPMSKDIKTGAKISVPPEDYPNFARFDDLNDPLTRKGVEFTDTLKVKDITIEITDGPVTQGLQKYLPWVPCLSRWSDDFVNQARHGRPLHYLYRYLNAAEYEGIKNIRTQRALHQDCTAFWNKMRDAFAKQEDLPPVNSCDPADPKCNPFDTPENRALFGKK
jgi:hypothetical protein